jgi:uncharacterized membrane protein YfcA
VIKLAEDGFNESGFARPGTLPAMPISVTELVLGLLLSATGAAIQGTIGFGFGVLTVPLLSLLNPIMAPVPQLLMVLPLTVAMFWRERHHIVWSGTAYMLGGRLPGALIGIVTIKMAAGGATSAIDAVIALAVLTAVGLLSIDVSVPRNPATEFAAGTAAGFMGMVASIGGPPLALLYRNEAGPTIRATLSAVFTVGLCVTIGTRAVTGEITADDVTIAALLMPAQIAGFLASFRLRWLIGGAGLRRAILIVSAIAAVALLVRAVA